MSHEFALIFNPSNPCCTGIQGIVDAYRQALPQVCLYTPTNSAPIINHVAMLAPQAAHQGSGSQHLVLLLPTDGAVTGVEAAREAVVCASHLRTLVILAGVGGADLEAVEQLGAAGGAWVHTPCRRAVCAPRPLPEGPSGDAGTEVPTQLVSYFKAHSHRFYPQPRARHRLLRPRFPWRVGCGASPGLCPRGPCGHGSTLHTFPRAALHVLYFVFAPAVALDCSCLPLESLI